MKKLGALVLAVVLALAITTPALADPVGTDGVQSSEFGTVTNTVNSYVMTNVDTTWTQFLGWGTNRTTIYDKRTVTGAVGEAAWVYVRSSEYEPLPMVNTADSRAGGALKFGASAIMTGRSSLFGGGSVGPYNVCFAVQEPGLGTKLTWYLRRAVGSASGGWGLLWFASADATQPMAVTGPYWESGTEWVGDEVIYSAYRPEGAAYCAFFMTAAAGTSTSTTMLLDDWCCDSQYFDQFVEFASPEARAYDVEAKPAEIKFDVKGWAEISVLVNQQLVRSRTAPPDLMTNYTVTIPLADYTAYLKSGSNTVTVRCYSAVGAATPTTYAYRTFSIEVGASYGPYLEWVCPRDQSAYNDATLPVQVWVKNVPLPATLGFTCDEVSMGEFVTGADGWLEFQPSPSFTGGSHTLKAYWNGGVISQSTFSLPATGGGSLGTDATSTLNGMLQALGGLFRWMRTSTTKGTSQVTEFTSAMGETGAFIGGMWDALPSIYRVAIPAGIFIMVLLGLAKIK